MARRPHFVSTVDEESGFRFVFKTDPANPDMLHIYARHLTTVEDAIETFFGGDPVWNPERRRYETQSDTHELHWFWLEQGRVVMVITCFRI